MDVYFKVQYIEYLIVQFFLFNRNFRSDPADNDSQVMLLLFLFSDINSSIIYAKALLKEIKE